MQKTLRINLLARNQAVKRAKKEKATNLYDQWAQYKRQDVGQEKALREIVKEERAHRREDWKLGPLAPDRNVGKEKGKVGALSYDLYNNPVLPRAIRRSPQTPGYSIRSTINKFQGTTIVGNVILGDRVVIVKGPQRLRGKIGFVSDIDLSREELRIANVNIIDIEKPAFLIPEPTEDNPNPDRFASQEGWIPMSSVRLVVRNEVTGQEFVVSQVHAGGSYIQRKFGDHRPAHTRYITGSEHWSEDGNPIEIPWPEEQINDEVRETLGDSARSEVEERTWTPSMYDSPLGYRIDHETVEISSPEAAYVAGFQKGNTSNTQQSHVLPGFSSRSKAEERQRRVASGIMNELRSQTSRSKRSHGDVDWVYKKMLEDARSIWWQGRKVLSPVELKSELKVKQAQEVRKAQLIATYQRETARAAETPSIPEADNQAEAQHDNVTQSLTHASKVVLDRRTEKLIRSMREVTMESVYNKPDKKFQSKLKHYITAGQTTSKPKTRLDA